MEVFGVKEIHYDISEAYAGTADDNVSFISVREMLDK